MKKSMIMIACAIALAQTVKARQGISASKGNSGQTIPVSFLEDIPTNDLIRTDVDPFGIKIDPFRLHYGCVLRPDVTLLMRKKRTRDIDPGQPVD